MIVSRIETRTIAGIRFVDGITNEPILSGIRIVGQGIRSAPNRLGIHQLIQAPGFESFVKTFDNPALPGQSVLDLGVEVSNRLWIPRRFRLTVPKSLDPNANNGVFVPESVWMAGSAARIPSASWAKVVVNVTHNGVPAVGAVVEVLRNGQRTLRGMIGPKGEALVPVPGLATLVASGNGNSVVSVADHDVSVRVVYDASTTQVPVDPDDILSRAGQNGIFDSSQAVQIQAGQATSLTFSLT